jgi:hypothetical protein
MTDITPTPSPAPQAAVEIRVNDPSTSTVVTSSDFVPKRSGVLATAVDASGSPAMELTDSTRVTVGGVQMPLRAAVQQGLLVKDQTGDYREPTAEERSASETAPEGATERVALDAETEAQVSGIINGFAEIGLDHSTIAAKWIAGDTRSMPEELATLAAARGVPVETLQATFANFVNKLGTQAGDLFRAAGLDVKEVVDFATTKMPREVVTKARLMHYNGSLDGWQYIANKYMEAKGISAAPRANADGVTVLGTKNGVVRVRAPGGSIMEFSETVARRAGWL